MVEPRIVDIEKKKSGQWWALYDDGKNRRVKNEVALAWIRSSKRPVVERFHADVSMLERFRRRAQETTLPTKSLLGRRRARRAERRRHPSPLPIVVNDDDNAGE